MKPPVEPAETTAVHVLSRTASMALYIEESFFLRKSSGLISIGMMDWVSTICTADAPERRG